MTVFDTPKPSELDQALADFDGNVARLETLVSTITGVAKGGPHQPQRAAVIRFPVRPRLRPINGGRADA